MPKPPRPPRTITRRTDGEPAERVADRAVVAKPSDPRQPGLFDAPLPGWMRPCLPTLVDVPPTGPRWIHEIKLDGYRVSAYVEDGKATIRTRNGQDWTRRFPTIAAALAALPVRSAILDGEAVILDESGRSSFAELQADLDRRGSERAALYAFALLYLDRRGSERAALYAFDLLYLDGEVLWTKTLEERRLALGRLVPPRSAILTSEEYVGDGADLFRIDCEQDLEGIVSKRLDQPYRGGRSRDWLKTKCVKSDVFVIVGYQPGSGAVRTPHCQHQGRDLRRLCPALRRRRGHRLRRGGGDDAAVEARQDHHHPMRRRRARGRARCGSRPTSRQRSPTTA